MKKTLIAASVVSNVVLIIWLLAGFLHPRGISGNPDIKSESGKDGFTVKVIIDSNRPYYIVNRGGKMTFDFGVDYKDAFVVPRLVAMPDLAMNIIVPIKPLVEKTEIKVQSPSQVVYVSEYFPKDYFSEKYLGRVQRMKRENRQKTSEKTGIVLHEAPPDNMVKGLIDHLSSPDPRIREKAFSLLKQINSPEAKKAVEQYERKITEKNIGGK